MRTLAILVVIVLCSSVIFSAGMRYASWQHSQHVFSSLAFCEQKVWHAERAIVACERTANDFFSALTATEFELSLCNVSLDSCASVIVGGR